MAKSIILEENEMGKAAKAASDPCRLRLEGDLTVFTAMDTKQRLLEPLAHCQQIDVDLSQVGEMDSAGLQLMLLFQREAAAQGKHVRFDTHSRAVLDVLELCRLTGQFRDPAVMAPAAGNIRQI